MSDKFKNLEGNDLFNAIKKLQTHLVDEIDNAYKTGDSINNYFRHKTKRLCFLDC